jgi:membrane associated rhomboid family serine protease
VDVATGRPIVTAQGLDEDELYGNAQTLVNIVSWILPFGLYPIASEAYGAFKPHATRLIVLLTISTTIAFWIFGGGASGPGRQLMLWAGSTSSQQIQAIYGSHVIGTLGHFEWYQLLTCAFLHEGWMHLAGNLLFLIVFGSRVNALVGQWKMAVLYPVLAIAASAAYCIAESDGPPMPCLGASGAIMGLAGMYLVLFPVHRVHNVIWFRICPWWAPFFMFRVWAATGGESGLLRPWMKLFALRGFWVVLFFISFDVVFTVFGFKDHVAHWAHLGGFIAGIILAIALLLTRLVDARGGDILSVVLGRYAWPLIGKPGEREAAVRTTDARAAAV